VQQSVELLELPARDSMVSVLSVDVYVVPTTAEPVMRVVPLLV
jgi:hypothetical protein